MGDERRLVPAVAARKRFSYRGNIQIRSADLGELSPNSRLDVHIERLNAGGELLFFGTWDFAARQE